MTDRGPTPRPQDGSDSNPGSSGPGDANADPDDFDATLVPDAEPALAPDSDATFVPESDATLVSGAAPVPAQPADEFDSRYDSEPSGDATLVPADAEATLVPAESDPTPSAAHGAVHRSEAQVADLTPPPADMTSVNPHAPVADSLPTIPDVVLSGEIGRGGQGVVYRGRQSYLDRPVAVKVLSAHFRTSDFARRFQREAKILAGLSHPNIVTCHQAGVAPNGECYLVMEFIDGPNLRQWLGDHGPLETLRALRLAKNMAEALGHALKAGVIHRDVKPENILLKPRQDAAPDDPHPFRAKLADLGLARPPSDGATSTEMNLTLAGAIVGTPSTMSPEQFDDPDHVDFRTDIYGLGCVLFHALTGEPAYLQKTITATITEKLKAQAPDAAKLRPEIPRRVAKLTSSMLARDRNDRPASYDDLIARIDELIQALDGSASKPLVPLLLGGSAIAAIAAGTYAWLGGAAAPEPIELQAIAPTAVEEGAPITLEGLVPNAGERELKFLWSQTATSGAPRVELADPSTPKQLFDAPQAAADYTLEFELSVHEENSAGPLIETVSVQVQADDDRPQVLDLAPTEAVVEGATVQLRIDARDPEGETLRYLWKQTPAADEPLVQLSNPAVAAPYFDAPNAARPYSLHFDVTATDAGGQSADPVALEIVVQATNEPPTVSVGPDRSVREGQRVELAASASDPESAELRSSWTVVSEPALALIPTGSNGVALDVPRGLIDPTVRLRFSVDDGEQVATDELVLEVQPDPALLQLVRGERLPLFERDFNDRLRSWDSTNRAQWSGVNDSNSAVNGHCPRGAAACPLRLPRGDWSLRGSLQPRIGGSRPTQAGGVRLELAGGMAIALRVEPVAPEAFGPDTARYRVRLVREERSVSAPDAWIQVEEFDGGSLEDFDSMVDTTLESWLRFEVRWERQRFEFAWGQQEIENLWATARVDPEAWAPNAGPGTVALFVDRGLFAFEEFTLEGR